MLHSAVEHYQAMQHLTVRAIVRVRSQRTNRGIATAITAFQVLAAKLGAESVDPMLEEQGLSTAAEAAVAFRAFGGRGSDGQVLAPLIAAVVEPSRPWTDLSRFVRGLVGDAGRNGQQVAALVRPAVTGHIRYVNPPCCSRCAILAGRWYRYSEGFLRHPQCDCVMVPANESAAPGLVSDPDEMVRTGQIRGLSKADQAALDEGADLSRLVNVRSKRAGLTRAGRIHSRGSRLTPEGIFSLASNRAEAVELLRQFRYIT